MPEYVSIHCVTLWQPWASAIAQGLKTIETREWSTRVGGLLGIHAGRSWDLEVVRAWVNGPQNLGEIVLSQAREEIGHLLAIARVAEMKHYTQGEWIQDAVKHLCPAHYWNGRKVGWVLENIRRIKPIRMNGHQGIWKYTGEVEYI